MKISSFQLFALSSLLAPMSYGLSLYDTAPPIGLPESYAVKYGAYIGVGYDDNLNSTKHNRKGGGYAKAQLRASYADYESVTKLSYDASLGCTLYNKEAYGTQQQLFSDSSLTVRLNHAFSSQSSWSSFLSLRYTPEPDYSNYISAPRSQGDCFNWSFSNSYSQAIDSRWSWTLGVGYSGNIYTQSEYKVDDRQYLSCTASLSYRYSNRTTVSGSVSGRYDMREHGLDSRNLYLNATVNHALSSIASMSVSLGAQLKDIDGETSLYPNIRFGYNRKLTEGLNASAYLSLDNENIDTYVGTGNYLSDLTWRLGANLSYVLSPTVSFYGGGSLIFADYSKGTNHLGGTEVTTWSLSAGMNYRFTESLTGTIGYVYTHASGDNGYGYYRNVISAGLTYSF